MRGKMVMARRLDILFAIMASATALSACGSHVPPSAAAPRTQFSEPANVGDAVGVGGRPSALEEGKIRAAPAMLASGNMSAIEVAQRVGCASSTLYRICRGVARP